MTGFYDRRGGSKSGEVLMTREMAKESKESKKLKKSKKPKKPTMMKKPKELKTSKRKKKNRQYGRTVSPMAISVHSNSHFDF